MSTKFGFGWSVKLAVSASGAPPATPAGGIFWLGDIWSFTDYGYGYPSAPGYGIVDLIDNAIAFFCGPGAKRLWFGVNWGNETYPLDVTDQLALRGHTIAHFNPNLIVADPDLHDFIVTGPSTGISGGSHDGRRDWIVNTFLGAEGHGVLLNGAGSGLTSNWPSLLTYCGLAASGNTGNQPWGLYTPDSYSPDVADIFDGVTGCHLYQTAAFSTSGSPTTGTVEIVPWGGSSSTAVWRHP